jgi:hypothetical protein
LIIIGRERKTSQVNEGIDEFIFKKGMGSTGQAKNPELKMNLSEKLFDDETTLMNQETMKNLASFRKLAVPKSKLNYKNISDDEELKVNMSFESDEKIDNSMEPK